MSSEKKQESIILHQQLICLFDKELVLDILLVIGQEMESRENRQYNLLIMEILHHLLKRQVCRVTIPLITCSIRNTFTHILTLS